MLMAGNVGVKRIRAHCLDFKNIQNVQQMDYQSPCGFEARKKDIFTKAPMKHMLPFTKLNKGLLLEGDA
jgi:spore germination cell wall hydrolase CwlJ-like protein